MKIDASDIAELRPLIDQAVRSTLVEIRAAEARTDGRLAYPEAEAAAMCGVERHTLRDLRLKGEITAKKIGKRWCYTRESLAKFLNEC